MNLAELQRDFRQWLVSSSDEVTHHITSQATAGLAVYQNNYRSQLVGCLEVSYPQLHKWLGAELFLQAAITHIDAHPPQAWTLDAYGGDFVDTLRTMFPHNPDVHELAWIEWSLSDAFIAHDVVTAPVADLSEVDWDTARLRLAPGLLQRAATTNAATLWSALQNDEAAPESAMLDEAGGLIVWRRGFTCQVKQVDIVEHAALLSLRDDDRFASLCDRLIDHLGEEAGVARAGALLAEWLSAGVIAGIDCPEEPQGLFNR